MTSNTTRTFRDELALVLEHEAQLQAKKLRAEQLAWIDAQKARKPIPKQSIRLASALVKAKPGDTIHVQLLGGKGYQLTITEVRAGKEFSPSALPDGDDWVVDPRSYLVRNVDATGQRGEILIDCSRCLLYPSEHVWNICISQYNDVMYDEAEVKSARGYKISTLSVISDRTYHSARKRSDD